MNFQYQDIKSKPLLQSVQGNGVALQALNSAGKSMEAGFSAAQDMLNNSRTSSFNDKVVAATEAKGAPLSTMELQKLRAGAGGDLSEQGQKTFAQNLTTALENQRDVESKRRFGLQQSRLTKNDAESNASKRLLFFEKGFSTFKNDNSRGFSVR